MKEVVFLDRNSKKWKEFETILSDESHHDPDSIADLYIQLTDDLSYAQTFYPNSSTAEYLNQLSMTIHQEIYKNQKTKKGKFKQFWTTDLPLVLFQTRKQLLYSLLIFLTATLLGVVSTMNDQSFVRAILGDNYVNMTIDNIKKGDPMAVYKQESQTEMFLGITVNNIKVSFMAFVFGMLTAFGTGYVLFNNGIMLGCFTYFFVENDLFWETTRVIWIHGTLEISAIIISGAAGLVLGNSIVFPGTLPRKTSMQIGVSKGIKIIIGIIPMFITAGFLEGYVTRHTEMPMWFSWIIIACSLLFVIWYFILHPKKVYQKLSKL
ncbi:hypothetical protein BZG02_06600 [Labilibaculum filiforme]|uniref:Stage II sporulation protein M n=1 Tax=Labilibaculum filiforme TaxID=1940526 RepID=A0A2N3I2E1_9BACT|nr:stage II sporulation protein M [Labilibaculum filiforme]PKQ64471.1 hypothetical protein BZG02_06600 [Labilibaculum filiforme]